MPAVKKKAVKKKTVKSVNKSDMRIDVDQARLFFTKAGKEYIIDLLPIDDASVVKLALERLYDLVKNSKEPYSRADWVKAGRPKQIHAPVIVKAIAEASGRPVGEVLKTWRTISKAEKEALSNDPVVIKAKKKLETPIDPKPSNVLLDLFM